MKHTKRAVPLYEIIIAQIPTEKDLSCERLKMLQALGVDTTIIRRGNECAPQEFIREIVPNPEDKYTAHLVLEALVAENILPQGAYWDGTACGDTPTVIELIFSNDKTPTECEE